jgi:hypothetical protein
VQFCNFIREVGPKSRSNIEQARICPDSILAMSLFVSRALGRHTTKRHHLILAQALAAARGVKPSLPNRPMRL